MFLQNFVGTAGESSIALNAPVDTRFFAQGDSISRGPTLSDSVLSARFLTAAFSAFFFKIKSNTIGYFDPEKIF